MGGIAKVVKSVVSSVTDAVGLTDTRGQQQAAEAAANAQQQAAQQQADATRQAAQSATASANAAAQANANSLASSAQRAQIAGQVADMQQTPDTATVDISGAADADEAARRRNPRAAFNSGSGGSGGGSGIRLS